jgi:hypothetical protein
MARFFRYILSILLISVYFLTSTGFGIHVCSDEGSAEVLILGSDRSCEEIHSHCGCDSDGCSATKHNNKCCKTEIYHLDLDYDVVKIESSISPLSIINIYDLISDQISPVAFQSICGYRYKEVRHGPDKYIFPDYLSYLSQWRL